MIKNCLIVALVITAAGCATVSVQESEKTVALATAGVSASIDKSNARVVKLVQNGTSLLAPGQSGYFTILMAGEGRRLHSDLNGCTFREHYVSDDTVDLAFVPKRSAEFPLDIEIHYVMRAGEPGFYFYVVASKAEGTPEASITQMRFAMRVDDSMLNIRLNDERHGVIPKTRDIRNAQGQVMDATYLTPSGDIVTKYEWSTPTAEAPVYGLNNGKQGVWMIRGGNDYLNGGPTKQHNTCHATDKGPILLHLFYSNHYGSKDSYIDAGRWQKVFGPTFVHLNQGQDADALWDDAKQRCATLAQSWPYQWVQQPEYSVKRSDVTGYFKNADNGWVVLARPTEARGIDWQKQGGDSYVARAPIQPDGSFKVPAVRYGTYTLYAISDGVVGEFRRDNVTVDTPGELELGALPWEPRSHGELLWRVGTPDRSAAEFRHGDDHRHWGLWFRYPKEFPNDVDFVVGRSDERTDWNYAQTAIWRGEDEWKPKLNEKDGEGTWVMPKWKIRFACNEPIEGLATLTLALAGVNRDGGIAVSLNGVPIAKVDDLPGDSSIHRHGIYGFFQERFVTFDAALLEPGENALTLEIVPKQKLRERSNTSLFGVMYDYIQLEVEKKKDSA